MTTFFTSYLVKSKIFQNFLILDLGPPVNSPAHYKSPILMYYATLEFNDLVPAIYRDVQPVTQLPKDLTQPETQPQTNYLKPDLDWH